MDSAFQTARYQICFGNEAKFKELLQVGLARQTATAPLDAAALLNSAVTQFEQSPIYLKLLLEAGYPLNLPDRSGETALMAAAGYGMVDAMQLLLDAGADPFWTNSLGANAASKSLVCGNPHCPSCERRIPAHAMVTHLKVEFHPHSADAAKQLFEAGRKPITWHLIPVMEALGVPGDSLGWTAFMKRIAAGTAIPQEVKHLSSADLAHRDTRDRTAFLLSVQADRIDLARAILQQRHDHDLDFEGLECARALHFATGNDSLTGLSWLLSLGISIDAQDENGNTPLMLAVEYGSVTAAEYLLKHGANIHARNKSGDQAIHNVRRSELLSLLIKAGADVGSRDNLDYQPIHRTIDLELIALLLDAGADVNAISGGGSWILNDIAAQGNAEDVAYLLNRGAKPDSTSTSGNTALFSAVRSDNIACVRVLLKAGADINAQESDGWTCLAQAKSPAMAEYLLQQGADPAAADASSLNSNFIPAEVRAIYQSYLLRKVAPGSTSEGQ